MRALWHKLVGYAEMTVVIVCFVGVYVIIELVEKKWPPEAFDIEERYE